LNSYSLRSWMSCHNHKICISFGKSESQSLKDFSKGI
jgi:hypothetical protein